MRNISWFFTVAAGIAIVAFFFKEEFLYLAWPLVLLAAWTDSLAIDVEMRL